MKQSNFKILLSLLFVFNLGGYSNGQSSAENQMTMSFIPLKFEAASINSSRGNSYQLASNAQVGDKSHLDREYRFSELPKEITGAFYVKTAMNDKNIVDAEVLLSLTINKPSMVYVAFDQRYNERPTWLKSFTESNLSYSFADTRYKLYQKKIKGGSIDFGSNKPNNEAGNFGMYTVFVKDLSLNTDRFL